MFKLMGKKILTILHSQALCIQTYVICFYPNRLTWKVLHHEGWVLEGEHLSLEVDSFGSSLYFHIYHYGSLLGLKKHTQQTNEPYDGR